MMARDTALVSLAGTASADRFRAWSGGSGRRHVFAIHPVGPGQGLLDHLPADGAAVVILVEKRGNGRQPVWIGEAAQLDGNLLRTFLWQAGPNRRELHIRLEADPHGRAELIADLQGLLGE